MLLNFDPLKVNTQYELCVLRSFQVEFFFVNRVEFFHDYNVKFYTKYNVKMSILRKKEKKSLGLKSEIHPKW